MKQKFLGNYVDDDIVGTLFDYQRYKPDQINSPLTPHSLHFYKNNCFITTPLFIKDKATNLRLLSQAIYLLYQQYPFLNADQVFDQKEKWEFYKCIQYEFTELSPREKITSFNQLSEIQNVSQINNEQQCCFVLYEMDIKGYDYKYLLLMQICHAICDGSSVLTLILKLNSIYRNLKQNPKYTIDKSTIQQAPFTVIACLNNNDRLNFQNSNFLKGGGNGVVPKIQSRKQQGGERSIGWELMLFDTKTHKLQKYSGSTLTLSLSFYQLSLQIAYGYQTGSYVDGDKQNLLIGNFSHRVYDDLKPYDFSHIVGNSVFNSIFKVRINKDMTFKDLIQQLKEHDEGIKKMTKDQKMDQMLMFELLKCPTRTHNYPMSVYQITMGKYSPEPDDIIQGYGIAPVQITTDYDIHFFNFTVVGLDDYYVFQWDNFGLDKQQRKKIVDMFWKLNQMQPDVDSKICDYIKFDRDLLDSL